MTENELKTIIENHQLWLEDNSKGEQADLRGVDFRRANLSGVDFRRANLSGANLNYVFLGAANFSFANLSGANLYCADLSFANLSGANLYCADLRESDLSYTNFSSANLIGANLKKINAWDTVGNTREIKSFQTEKYTINIINGKMVQIGCEQHSFDDWMKFDDETISYMDTGALDWWKKWKPILKILVDSTK